MARDVVTKEYMSSTSSSTNSGAARVGLATIAGLVSTQVQAAISEIVTLLGGKANTSHVHAAGDVTSGSFAVARLGTGTPAASKYVDGGTGAWTTLPGGGGSTQPFPDDTALVKDNVDATKLLRVEVGAIATGTTRVLTVPNVDVNLTADQAAGTASLRTLGTGAQQAAPGNDTRFKDYDRFRYFHTGDVATGTTTGVGHDPVDIASTVDKLQLSADTAPSGGTITATFVREATGPGGAATTIGTLTLAAGSRFASTTTITNATLADGDTIRVDLSTGAGYTTNSAKNVTAKARASY